MDNYRIPPINRTLPRFLLLLNTISFYLIFVPFNWIYSLFGRPAAMILLANKIVEGPTGGIKAFQAYEPGSQDVFVCTFAKSGTNWLMQLALQSLFRGECEFANIHDAVPWPDMDAKRLKMLPLGDQHVLEACPEHKRVIKTHLGREHVPYSEEARYLVVIRDPKEIYVSSYYFGQGSFGPLMPDPDTWFELFFSKDFPFNFGCNWAEHTAGYWAMRNQPNVLLLQYSEMKASLSQTVSKVSESLGVALSREEVERVITRSSFDYMKNIDDRFMHTPAENVPWSIKPNMIRSGKEGNSAELLTPEQQHRIDAYCLSELKRLGSDFPYEALFCRQGH